MNKQAISEEKAAKPPRFSGSSGGWRSAYRTSAVIAMNTGLLFLALNLVSIPVARLQARRGVTHNRSVDDLRASYPGWQVAEIEELLAERERNNLWEYEAFTEFRQQPVTGRYINVSADGFRHGKTRQPWPPSPEACTVSFFGGSTAYGDRLPDGETIPAALEENLPSTSTCRAWSVYNFGRPGYYSTQERILFEQLLQLGVIPRFAVFLNGLNDFFYEEPPKDGRPWRAGQTENLARLIREHNTAGSCYRFVQLFLGLPLTRVIRLALPERTTPPAPESARGCAADRILQRWRENRRITEGVAAQFGVRPLFVWQPIPAYHYEPRDADNRRHLSSLACARKGYEVLSETRAQESTGNFLWLADVQRGRTESLYIDEVHYTAEFSREIARAIGNAIMEAP